MVSVLMKRLTKEMNIIPTGIFCALQRRTMEVIKEE
jgi:hypothetical protein